MTVTVDLIYVEYPDRTEMSCAVFGDGKDKLIGPVPGEEAVKNLAPGLHQHLPTQFRTVKDAEMALVMTHFRNLCLHKNAAGQDYPFKIGH